MYSFVITRERITFFSQYTCLVYMQTTGGVHLQQVFWPVSVMYIKLGWYIYKLTNFKEGKNPTLFSKCLRFMSILLMSAYVKYHTCFTSFCVLLFLHIYISFSPTVLKKYLSIFIVLLCSLEQNFIEPLYRCCYSFVCCEECKSFKFNSSSCKG